MGCGKGNFLQSILQSRPVLFMVRRFVMPLVSIIVPVYNVEKTLERCVRSLQEQSLQDLEIILVDDGTKDASGKLAEQLAAGDQRIRVIHKENEGLGLTRNAGMRLAQGTYVGFVDSDDYVDPQMFEKLVQEAERTGADAVYGGYVRVFEGKVSSRTEFEAQRVYEGKEQLMELMLSMLACPPEDPEDSRYGATVWKGIYRRETLEKNHIQFYSEREYVSEDGLFQIDFLSHASRAAVIPGAFYFYEYNPDSLTSVYRPGRFAQNVALYELASQKIRDQFGSEAAANQFGRNFLAAARVCLMQEVFHEKEAGKNKTTDNMHEINRHPVLRQILETYPWQKFPFKKRVFAWAMDRDWPWLESLLVKASS